MSLQVTDPQDAPPAQQILDRVGVSQGLLGRRAECDAIGRLLTEASAGRSGVLVVRGEAGIGKSALLHHARDTALAMGMRVESAVGVEAETQFAFAGLHQLCAPLLDRAETLPDPQRTALGVALGRQAGAAPDRFLVGLAVLNLLAEEGPMLCLVDDAQWLDQASAQVLAFIARRVGAERLALMFAVRDPGESGGRDALAGLPELRLDGLGEADARALLTTAMCAPLDEGVRDRIVAEARGNPLALLELPSSVQLAGGFGLPDAVSVPRRVEDNFQRRSNSLPTQTQQLLLVAASEPTGDPALLWRAVDFLGIDREAAAPAETAGLLEIDTRVRFRHPLVRSAVYRAATAPEHRRAHCVLAAATDPHAHPDRRAWHRAQSVLGTDEEAAADLERSADRALARGGFCAAAAFLRRATDLTPEPADRARRALDAANAEHCAGAPEAALALLDSVEAGRLDALQRARLELLRAQITFHLTQGSEVLRMLLGAARMLAPLDPSLARETYLQAFDAATIIGGPGLREIVDAVGAAPAPPGAPSPADLLLDGLVAVHTNGFQSGAPVLKRALEAFREHVFPVETVRAGDAGNWLWLATRTASALFDDELLIVLADRYVQLARRAGALATLPAALVTATCTRIYTGDLSRAAELADEAAAIAKVSGAMPLSYAKTLLDAWRGIDSETTARSDLHGCGATENTRGADATIALLASAVLHNGRGNYPAAQKAAAFASDAYEPAIRWQALHELVEAAIRAGDPESASRAMEDLSMRARASGTEWALGVAARSRALTSTAEKAEAHYREAIERLQNCRMEAFLARTHLVYGEWLRREGRRSDAREQLRTAHSLLSNMGAELFADRAARELRATGERARKRTSQPSDALTAQELTIARLVATGATSREVGEQLFLSPRTIEAHLRNIFRKLGITSRRQLKELPLP